MLQIGIIYDCNNDRARSLPNHLLQGKGGIRAAGEGDGPVLRSVKRISAGKAIRNERRFYKKADDDYDLRAPGLRLPILPQLLKFIYCPVMLS